MNSKVNKILEGFADKVIVDGASSLLWGEKEIPDSLKEMYKRAQEDEKNENN